MVVNNAAQRDFNDLLECMKNQGGSYDIALIKKAFNYCVDHHLGQKRLTNEEYYIHPFNVAKIIVTLGMDSQSIAAALLHDVIEDTASTEEDIRREFGDDVSMLVSGVTKLKKIPHATREEAQAENIRKMLLAMAEDIRIIIIKLADRLHNLRTLSALPPDKQKKIAKESLEVFAPLADRLNMGRLRVEMADLAFKYVDPRRYEELKALIAKYTDIINNEGKVESVDEIGKKRLAYEINKNGKENSKRIFYIC